MSYFKNILLEEREKVSARLKDMLENRDTWIQNLSNGLNGDTNQAREDLDGYISWSNERIREIDSELKKLNSGDQGTPIDTPPEEEAE